MIEDFAASPFGSSKEEDFNILHHVRLYNDSES